MKLLMAFHVFMLRHLGNTNWVQYLTYVLCSELSGILLLPIVMYFATCFAFQATSQQPTTRKPQSKQVARREGMVRRGAVC